LGKRGEEAASYLTTEGKRRRETSISRDMFGISSLGQREGRRRTKKGPSKWKILLLG